jgi:hypothetical protein
MRKTLLFLCLIGFVFSNLQAQKAKLNWGQKSGLTVSDASPEFEVLGLIQGYYYILIKHYSSALNKTQKIITRVTLQKFDASHNQMFSKDIIPEAGSGFLKAFVFSDHFQFFYQGLDEKKKIALYTQEIGFEGNETTVPQLIDSKSPTKPGFETYKIELFDNDYYLVSYNFQYDKNHDSYFLGSKSSVIVLSRMFQKVFESEIGLITKDSKIIHSQLFGGDNGNLVLVNTSNSKIKNEYINLIAEFNYETKEYRKIESNIYSKHFKFCQNENQFILLSLDERFDVDNATKIYFQSIDRESFKLDEAVEINWYASNESAYLANNEEFLEPKSKIIKPLKKFLLNKVSLNKDGNLVIRINESTKNGEEITLNTGNLIVLCIDKWGKYNWSKMIQRKNQFAESNPEFAGVLEFEIGGKLVFIFNDNSENSKADGSTLEFIIKPKKKKKPQTTIVSWVSVSNDGKYSKGQIDDISNLERAIYFNPQLSKMGPDGNGVILMNGQEKTKLGYKLGIIRFSLD